VLFTIGAWFIRRRIPYVLLGWLWLLGMLVPVLGVIQVGSQSMADRFLYLPSIGLTIAVVWAVADWAERAPGVRGAIKAAAVVVLAVLAMLTWVQQGTWRTTEDVFAHALAVDERNALAHGTLGRLFALGGDDATAIAHLRRSIELRADDAKPYLYLGFSLRRTGRPAEAVDALRKGAAIDPNQAEIRALLGAALSDLKQFDAADVEFAASKKLDPSDANLYVLWGTSYADRGDRDAARRMFEEALRFAPDRAAARDALERLSRPKG
jgi:tetratricopeptide (TPR) repeat protein